MASNEERDDWRRDHPELADLPLNTVFHEPSASDPTPQSTLHDLAPNANRGWLSPYSLWTKRSPVSPVTTWQPRSRSGTVLRTAVGGLVLLGLAAGIVAGILAVLRG